MTSGKTFFRGAHLNGSVEDRFEIRVHLIHHGRGAFGKNTLGGGSSLREPVCIGVPPNFSLQRSFNEPRCRSAPRASPPADVVLFYDGLCGLCHATVQFVLRHDARGAIKFAALQSPLGERLRAWAGLVTEGSGTMILVEKGRAYTRSSAALRLVRHLDWPYPLLYCGAIAPRVLRDAVYNFIARNRYRWFGTHDSCALPSPELKKRFL